MTTVRVLERISRNAPFGVRFWDPATGTSTIDDLHVEVFPRNNPHARAIARRNRTGVYVVHRLPSSPPPGIRDFEFSGAEPDVLWAFPPRAYRVEVTDPYGRFLPIAFDADLPARGLFTWRAPWLSPPQPVSLPGEPGSPAPLMLDRVPLFSAPTRPVPTPLAVLYAQIREFGTGREASWCVLTVSTEGVVRGVGLADARGRIAVIFPYPEPPRISLASPPEARNDFTWQLALQAFGPASTSPPAPVPAFADLADVFASLSMPRLVVESTVSPALPLRLTYREALTARTAGAAGPDASFLFVS